jgi:uncharacterized RDD family membrane protein YckC
MDFSIKRILASLIDHLVFGSISATIALPGLIYSLLTSSFGLQFQYGSLYLNTLAMAVYIGKDVIMPHSIGKRVMKLVLTSARDQNSLRSYQLLLRNVTFIIWPVEILIELIKPESRIGDLIARTKVSENNDINYVHLISKTGRISVFLLALVCSYLIQSQVLRMFEYINTHVL